MKKTAMFLVLASVLFLGFPVSKANAEIKHNAGCGLGTMIMQDMNGTLWEVLGATTNGTFGNQTFGMSTGTLGCKQAGKVAKNDELNLFVSNNMDNLAKDIAKGNGESLDTVAELMNVPAAKKADVYAKLQAGFDSIFTAGNVQASDVVERILQISNS